MTNEFKTLLKEHYKKIGKKGGTSTVEKYGKLKMYEWGKLGGRPKTAKTSQKKLAKIS